MQQIERAEVLLGYTFQDKELLKAALTHPSATEGMKGRHSYERLEFLGDSILGAIVAYDAFARFPDLDEGGLTRIKVHLVSGKPLSKVADDLGLASVIFFGHSERGTGGRGLHSALENVYEAVVAAIALDADYDTARRFVERTLLPYMTRDMAEAPENPKSELQERLQEHHITPVYEIIETDGPPHARLFVAQAIADGIVLATGKGRSKKEAETDAAQAALETYDECTAALAELHEDQRA